MAGRYGLSVGTLHHHRAWHVLEPTLGDILKPVSLGEGWRQWDGKRWLKITEPEREDLIEVSKGRPNGMHNRFAREVYRRRRTPKPLEVEVCTDRQGALLVTNCGRFDWVTCKLFLNDQYVLDDQYVRSRRFRAGDRLRFPTREFVNDQGARFDWRSTKPLKLRIVADIKIVKGYRRGSVTLHGPAGKPARGRSR